VCVRAFIKKCVGVCWGVETEVCWCVLECSKRSVLVCVRVFIKKCVGVC